MAKKKNVVPKQATPKPQKRDQVVQQETVEERIDALEVEIDTIKDALTEHGIHVGK